MTKRTESKKSKFTPKRISNGWRKYKEEGVTVGWRIPECWQTLVRAELILHGEGSTHSGVSGRVRKLLLDGIVAGRVRQVDRGMYALSLKGDRQAQKRKRRKIDV